MQVAAHQTDSMLKVSQTAQGILNVGARFVKSLEGLNQGVAKLWVNEVHDVRLVIGKQLFVKLPAIEGKHKQLQCVLQSFEAA
jgi:hypothetical protein